MLISIKLLKYYRFILFPFFCIFFSAVIEVNPLDGMGCAGRSVPGFEPRKEAISQGPLGLHTGLRERREFRFNKVKRHITYPKDAGLDRPAQASERAIFFFLLTFWAFFFVFCRWWPHSGRIHSFILRVSFFMCVSLSSNFLSASRLAELWWQYRISFVIEKSILCFRFPAS